MAGARAISAKRRERSAGATPAGSLSLAPLVATLAPHLPPEVVSPAAVARMQRAASTLFPVSGVGFEARLAGDPAQVDLCMRVMPEDGSAAILGGWHHRHAPAAPLLDDPYWQRLARLSRLLWAADDVMLRPFVNRIGLELDSNDLDGACARPSIAFFDLPTTTGPNGAGLVKTMTDIVLPLARERIIGPEQRRQIRAVVAALVPIGRLRHVGVPLQRPDSAIRLVFGVPLDRIAHCLTRLGFGARADAIGAAASVIGHDVTEIALQVDVGDALGPKVGIEFHASKAEAWAGLLKRLTAHRLCTPERAIALAGWQQAPAELQQLEKTAQYVAHIPDNAERLGQALPVRLLSHVKVLFPPNDGLEAKIYLYAGFLWRRTQS
jgi:hypothetical protein